MRVEERRGSLAVIDIETTTALAADGRTSSRRVSIK